jgi:hypothetical protein
MKRRKPYRVTRTRFDSFNSSLAVVLLTGVAGYAMANLTERFIEDRMFARYGPLTAPLSVEQQNQENELAITRQLALTKRK